MATLTIIGDIAFIILGYVLSIMTWTWVRTQFTGVAAEIDKLRTKAAALEATLKSK